MKNGIIVFWIISLVCAFFLGQQYDKKPTQSEPEIDSHINQPIIKNEIKEPNSFASKIETSKIITINDKEFSQVDDVPLMIDIVSTLKSKFGNNPMAYDIVAIATSYDLIKELNEDEILEALSLLDADANPAMISMPLNLLLSRYAEINPESSMRYIENSVSNTQKKNMAMFTIISTWAKNSPLEAYDWYEKSTRNNSNSSKINSFTLPTIFTSLAQNNLPDAIDKLSDLTGQANKARMAVLGITNTLSEPEDFINLIERTGLLEDNQIITSIVNHWAMKDPQETIQWLETNENIENKDELERNILTTWMSSKPKQAADWYVANADDTNKQQYANNVVENWAYRNPQAALSWINEQSEIDAEQSIVKLLNVSAYSDVNFVLENFDKISSDKEKESLSVTIYSSLRRQSKTKAEEFLAASPYKQTLEKTIQRMNAHSLKN